MNLKPKDIVAIVALIVLAVLKIQGLDGTIDVAISLILGYYFAHRKKGDDNGH